MAVEAVNWRRRRFPFNAEQTVNIVAEVGPLFAMFIVNGLHGISGGTWALIICTVLSLLVTLWVLGRPPIMPFIGWVGEHLIRSPDAHHRRSHVGADQGDPI